MSSQTGIVAEYAGECVECGEPFGPGTCLTRHRDGWGHTVCPTPALEVRRPVCPCCFTEKSAAGTCGCPQ